MTGDPFPDADWRLHLGAHKTATTHLQCTMEAIRPQLKAKGVDLLLPKDLRVAWDDHIRWHRRQRRPYKWLLERSFPPPRRIAKTFAVKLAERRTGAPTVIASEENFLGDPNVAISIPPYPTTAQRLRLLRALIGRRARVQLFLGIRNMGDFLPSVYAEALRFFPVDGTFETALGPALAAPPRWSHLVAEIARAWPGAEITVWRYEDYRPNVGAIVARLAGADPGTLPQIPPPTQTMTPSASAVRAVEADRHALSKLDYTARAAAVDAIYAAAPATSDAPAFRPMDPAALARCRAAYADDCATLSKAGHLFTPLALRQSGVSRHKDGGFHR